MIKVPENCLACGAPWSGGHEVPGQMMREGLRVFYECGASMSVKNGSVEGVRNILFKNCSTGDNADEL